MINAQDDTLTQPSASKSRRSSGVTKARKTKRAGLKKQSMLSVDRVFSQANVSPFDQIQWDKRVAEITDGKGNIIFRQEGVEVPQSWSMLATNVVVSKYFYGEQGAPTKGSFQFASSFIVFVEPSPTGASRMDISARKTVRSSTTSSPGCV